jgi:hypothetical protein
MKKPGTDAARERDKGEKDNFQEAISLIHGNLASAWNAALGRW